MLDASPVGVKNVGVDSQSVIKQAPNGEKCIQFVTGDRRQPACTTYLAAQFVCEQSRHRARSPNEDPCAPRNVFATMENIPTVSTAIGTDSLAQRKSGLKGAVS
jgi:hypothetical protein